MGAEQQHRSLPSNTGGFVELPSPQQIAGKFRLRHVDGRSGAGDGSDPVFGPAAGGAPVTSIPAGRLQSRLRKLVAMSEATEQRLSHPINDLARIRNPARSLPKNHILWRRDTLALKFPGSTRRRPALRPTGIESRAVAGNSWRGVPPPYLCGRAIPNVPVR